VIVPIYRGDDEFKAVSVKANELVSALRKAGVSVKFDDRDTHKPGWKFAEYELKGVPLRIALGPRDLENGTVEIARRDTLTKESFALDSLPIEEKVKTLLDEIQTSIYQKANDFKESHTTEVNSWEEFQELLESKGGFLSAHWDGTSETEDKIKELTKATIRCIPLDQKEESGKCVLTGKPSKGRVLFAKAY
ncbi:MAG: His/Gly/Thr/Pro-type tRNA ligase C-terminal domain-containing protein, partial [Cyclobacteriaceae bacterium]|nr:His/Gly/Thr/Pro-type tRNA ligase C-terminal domain-containing protein [Cyclobacteriaceae bacterium]